MFTPLHYRNRTIGFTILFEECRRKATPCMIAFFDCDNFKKINDEQGHDAGDEILKQVGKILKQSCSEKGNAYRFGGDEFIIVHACESMEKAEQLVERIRDRFEKERIAISIGFVVTDIDNNMILQEYLNIADQVMYENKRKKKNESMVER